jgi:hypothetical protein
MKHTSDTVRAAKTDENRLILYGSEPRGTSATGYVSITYSGYPGLCGTPRTRPMNWNIGESSRAMRPGASVRTYTTSAAAPAATAHATSNRAASTPVPATGAEEEWATAVAGLRR